MTLRFIQPHFVSDSTLTSRSSWLKGGTSTNDSYVGKYTRSGEAVFLVPASRGVLNKVYSPTVRKNGSLLVADAFNNRIVQVNCVDANKAPVSCVNDAAVDGEASTLTSTFYPRAVQVAIDTDGSEVAFFVGGNGTSDTTYLRKIVLATGAVSDVLTGAHWRWCWCWCWCFRFRVRLSVHLQLYLRASIAFACAFAFSMVCRCQFVLTGTGTVRVVCLDAMRCTALLFDLIRWDESASLRCHRPRVTGPDRV